MISVVVFDDNEHRLKSLSTLFEFSDTITCLQTFNNCIDIENKIAPLLPNVILMDIEMPEIDGIKAVGILKKKFPRIKIIMQTVFEDSDKIFAALQAGAEGYILKSATGNTIMQSIEEVNNGGAFMSPSVAIKVMQYFHKSTIAIESSLSPKEIEVLKYLTEGNSYKMIAHKMNITYFTVNSHVKKVYEKLQVHSVSEAVVIALKNNLV